MGTNGIVVKGVVEISNEGFLATLSNFLLQARPTIDFHLLSTKLDQATLTGKKSEVRRLEPEISSSVDNKALINEATMQKKEKNHRYFPLHFDVPEDFGRPEAILLESQASHEFFLESITLEMLIEEGNIGVDHIIFSTKSWIYPSEIYPGPRIFFSDKAYLPSETPEGLKSLRKQELEYLRGDGSGERKKGERIYDYDLYNNLGNPDKDASLARPVLGGSPELPYPRRCRTGGKHTKADPKSETPSSSPYIPRDEMFSAQKSADITKVGIRTAAHEAQTLLSGHTHFKSFEEVDNLYAGKLDPAFSSKYALDTDLLKFPPPMVVQANKKAWMTDEEFARQRLAGMNPMKIQRLKQFPPHSSLDSSLHGYGECGITEAHLEGRLEDLTIEGALLEKRLYILDYHDSFITPYIARINEGESKLYSSRTLFFLTKAGLLLPVAIELSLPPKEANTGEAPSTGWTRKVLTPPLDGKVDWLWQLAKAHVAVVDASHQHLCSHWLKTHACMEPFIIATRRHLSAMHPIHKLLSPHFKDTMNANAAARQSFLNSGGRIERCFSTGKYSNEVSSLEYKQWRFDEQAVPNDLIARGMAEVGVDGTLQLHIEDYPYAQDALELWAPIQAWVEEYVGICYSGEDEAVATDEELQAWWTEIRHVGHGDHSHATWWGSMSTCAELIDTISTLLWISTGLHSVVDFGQYPFAGFMPNGPTAAWLHVPEEGSPEHHQLLSDPPAFFLASLSSKRQATTTMGTFETTSQHMSEETYLGGDGDVSPLGDPRVVDAHQRFREAICKAHDRILSRISSPSPHRAGPSQMPFTLLLPFSGEGLTGRGVPNSISI